MEPAQLAPIVAASAFALAFVFGAVGHKTNFCTMGAVSDWVNMGDLNRMRMGCWRSAWPCSDQTRCTCWG